jgi:hypothetical protein
MADFENRLRLMHECESDLKNGESLCDKSVGHLLVEYAIENKIIHTTIKIEKKIKVVEDFLSATGRFIHSGI